MKSGSFSRKVLTLMIAALIAGCGLSGDPQKMIAKALEHRTQQDYKGALIELKNALQKDPNNAEARYWLGVTHNDTLEYRLAESELRRALELRYDRSKVLPALGRSMLQTGQFQKVIDQIPIESSMSLAVQADVLTLHARALTGLGRTPNAQAALNAALAKQAEFPDALVEQARMALAAQKPEEAASLIERALAKNPQHVDAWFTKAELARLNQDVAGQAAANQKVLDIQRHNLLARLNLASLHIANNKLDEARKLITQARALAPKSIMTGQMQALLDLRAGNHKAANEMIQQVLKSAPNHMPSVALAAAILSEMGSHKQAQAHIQTVLEQMPGDIQAQRLMITILTRSGQMPRALEVLQTALSGAPEDSQLLALAGELYSQRGEFSKAVEYFDKAARFEPKNVATRVNLGKSRMATGDVARAFADIEMAIKLDPTNYQTEILLLTSYIKHGSYDQAFALAESLQKKHPKNPIVFNMTGVTHLGKKDIPGARKSFTQALELQPSFLDAAINLAQLDVMEGNAKAARGKLEAVLKTDKSTVRTLLALTELGPAIGATHQEQLAWLEQAQKLEPQSIKAPMQLVALYSQAGAVQKALEVAQQLQTRHPENPQLLELLAAMQTRAGQHEPARTTYRKLIQLQPTAAITAVRQELQAKRYAEALKIARQTQALHANSPIGHMLEGDILMAERNYPQAVKAYEASHDKAKSGATLVKLHKAYAADGKGRDSMARLAQWLKQSPDDAAVRLYMGDNALNAGRHKEAITHYERLQKSQPDNPIVLNNLAWAYYQARDERALETAERAYKLVSGNAAAPNPESLGVAKVADTLGWLLVENGDTARGIELLEKAAKAAPATPSIGLHLAQGWLKAGEKSKARAELERLLAMTEKFPEKQKAADLLKRLRKS